MNIGQWITIREDIGKINGNKRIGTHAMLVLLTFADDSLTYEELLKWVLEHQNEIIRMA